MNLDAHVTATQFRARIYFVNYFLVDLCLSFPKEIVYHVSESQSGSFLIVSHWCIEIFISNYLSVLWSIKDSNLQFSSLSPGNTLHRYLKQISSLSKIFTYASLVLVLSLLCRGGSMILSLGISDLLIKFSPPICSAFRAVPTNLQGFLLNRKKWVPFVTILLSKQYIYCFNVQTNDPQVIIMPNQW